mmetsp:Transcript_21952/g.60935  ORF Transcript_21952/g.60935 Transcript_21952/m.60935 type:complete len:99 (+) Transcript_21952:91-387(+)
MCWWLSTMLVKGAGSFTVPWNANQQAATAEMFPGGGGADEASTVLQQFMEEALEDITQLTPPPPGPYRYRTAPPASHGSTPVLTDLPIPHRFVRRRPC